MNLLRLLADAHCAAAIFDMDGVITETIGLHSRAWKQSFDELLETLPISGERARPFDLAEDYPAYVDGRTRLEGIRAFLASRGIMLPMGNESDPPFTSMQGLATYKNALYHRNLSQYGVKVFEDSVALIGELRKASLKIGLATSSRNAGLILEKAGLQALFDIVVDGNDVHAFGLQSKPAPDIFVCASQRLGVSFGKCAVFEDSYEALSRVAELSPACAIGVNRKGDPATAKKFGKLTVVTDLQSI